MWNVASQPIAKTYYSSWMSRSYLVSLLCRLTLLLPLLVLASISYSWNSHALTLQQPTLTYENHQLTCLTASHSVIYDSSFTNDKPSYQSMVSVSTTPTTLAVAATIIPSVDSCSLILYLKCKLTNSYSSLVTIPLSFQIPLPAYNQIYQKGTVNVEITSAIPESAVAVTGIEYFTESKYGKQEQLNMEEMLTRPANMSAFVNVGYSQAAQGSGTTLYQGTFEVPAKLYTSEVPLITNLRLFIPLLVYLALPLWYFLAEPILAWMLENKIYRAKVQQQKSKSL